MSRAQHIRPYWIGFAVSQAGTSAWKIALPWAVFVHTHSVFGLAATSIAAVVPEVLFTPVAGLLVDRRRRLNLIAVLDLVRAILYLACASAATVLSTTSLLWTVGVIFVLDGMSQLTSNAARIAVLRDFSAWSGHPLRSLLGTDRSIRTLADIVGLVAGSVLVGALNLAATLFVNGFSFLAGVAGALISLRLFTAAGVTTVRGVDRHADDIWVGLRILHSHPAVADALVRQLLLNIPVPLISLGLPVMLVRQSHGPMLYGASVAAFSIGAFALSMMMRGREFGAHAGSPIAWLVLGGAGVPLAAAFAMPAVLAPGAFLVVGSVLTWLLLNANLQWQAATPPGATGRVASIASLLARVGALGATLLVSACLLRGLTFTVTVICGLLVTAAMLALALRSRVGLHPEAAEFVTEVP
jgi:hypothetical protein